MANPETTCKVNYVGVWYEDTFTDEVMKTIAAHSQVEKGKKVKLTLNNDGIKVSRSKIFQQNLVEFYSYHQMKAVTKNPRLSTCVMFILDGKDKKYKIIVVRCPSDSNSIYIVNRVSQFRENARVGNVEFKKHDNGNWTLRDRSAHNANMHLREIFNEQQDKPSSNGDATKLNGGITHVPVLDRSKEPVIIRQSAYVKRNGSVTRPADHPGDIHVAVKDEGIRDADHLKELLEHAKIADAASGSRRGSRAGLPSKLSVAGGTVTSADNNDAPLVLRATPKTYDARIVGTSRQPDAYYSRLARHRRVSGDFVLPVKMDRKYSTGQTSMRGSTRVQFDTESMASAPRKAMSMRIRPVTAATPASYSTSTTIHRSIEDTYARPVLVQQQRRSSGNVFVKGSRSHRPSSVHVMGGNELRVYRQGSGVAL